jgi:hypothetical protein
MKDVANQNKVRSIEFSEYLDLLVKICNLTIFKEKTSTKATIEIADLARKGGFIEK